MPSASERASACESVKQWMTETATAIAKASEKAKDSASVTGSAIALPTASVNAWRRGIWTDWSFGSD